MEIKPVNLDLLFETSWEVCNKVGGIYTVLSTKSDTLQKLYKDKVVFIGPDLWSESNPSPVFKETPSLLKGFQKKTVLPHGISVRVGRWLIPGKPIAVLVKFDGMFALNNGLYAQMWEKFGVDSLHAYGDYDEACAFSHAAGIVVEAIYNHLCDTGSRVIAHFDEWTTGMGLLYVKSRLPHVATIFTTHATSIGRSICGNGKPLYDYLRNYNGDQMARELNMEAKHSLEKAAAHNADCFTTVSTVTAVECEQLLERKPDVVTPNGFEAGFVPASAKFATVRAEARKKLLDVARALTGKQTLSDDNTFIIGTSGRCEYRNKGIDMYLDALTNLGKEISGCNVVAFVMVPAWTKEARAELAARMEAPESGKPMDMPWLTHTVNNPGEDPIYNRIAWSELGNFSAEGNLHVIYTPCYLNGDDGIFNRHYYDILIGMDATVFPSYYEPWGYTPLESIAFGVPTVTTNLSGFGQWILDTFDNQFDACGVNVIDRNDSNYPAAVYAISSSLRFLIESGLEERGEFSKKAREAASKAAWTYFVKYYIDAFETALSKVK